MSGAERHSPAGMPDAAEITRFDYIVLHCGGIGDLCLASDLVASLKSVPAARVALICRSGFSPVIDLYPVRPDRVLEIHFEPRMSHAPSPDLTLRLQRLATQLSSIAVDTLFCGDVNTPWFAWLAAAFLRPRRIIVASRRSYPREILAPHLKSFGLAEPSGEGPVLPATIHERERYASMAEHAGGIPRTSRPWRIPEPLLGAAMAWLGKAGLRSHSYFLAVPYGNTANRTKVWPLERLETVLAAAGKRHGFALLVAGEVQRRQELFSLAERLSARSLKAVAFAGESADIGLLAGLTASAAAYVGIDTGPAHLAQAYGIPAAIVFGGDAGLHYTPWGRGAVGVMQPVPCFGCLADCAFDSPLCIESVPYEELTRSLDMALAEIDAPPKTRFLSPLPEPLRSVVAGANQRYRTSKSKLSALAEAMVQARSEIAGLRDEIAEVRGSPSRLTKSEQRILRRYRARKSALQWAIDRFRREKAS